MTKKQKNIILVIGFLLSVYICYQLAISKTLDQKAQHDRLSKEVMLSKNAPKQLLLLNKKAVYYDSILSKHHLAGTSIQNNLLKFINSNAEAHNLKVVSFLEPHVINQNELVIKTYDFTVEGDYNNINQLIYQLEQRTKYGEIINLHFEKKKNFRTGKSYLQARVLLKSFG